MVNTWMVLFGACSLLLISANAIRAQESHCTGELSASALQPLPQNLPVGVTLYDDERHNLRFRDRLVEGLQNAGYQVREEAPLMFAFRADLPEAMPPRRSTSPLDPVPGLPQSDENYVQYGVAADWLQQVDRTTPRPGRESGTTATRLQLEVMLRDTRSGQVVWMANLYCDPTGGPFDLALQSLVAPLLRNLGNTVRYQAF